MEKERFEKIVFALGLVAGLSFSGYLIICKIVSPGYILAVIGIINGTIYGFKWLKRKKMNSSS